MELRDITGERILRAVPRTDVRHPFDVGANGALFCLNDETYLVFEDPSDGYRSSAGPLFTFSGSADAIGGFYVDWLEERVICSHATTSEYGSGADILEVRSAATGKAVFRVGTDNVEDYYPSFVAQWFPEGLSANSQERLTT